MTQNWNLAENVLDFWSLTTHNYTEKIILLMFCQCRFFAYVYIYVYIYISLFSKNILRPFFYTERLFFYTGRVGGIVQYRKTSSQYRIFSLSI